MIILALTPWEKLEEIPADFWIKALFVIFCLILMVLLLRRVARMNKIILSVLLFVVFAIVGFQWIYERNEPAALTPAIDKIAPFFPSKDAYATQQKKLPRE